VQLFVHFIFSHEMIFLAIRVDEKAFLEAIMNGRNIQAGSL